MTDKLWSTTRTPAKTHPFRVRGNHPPADALWFKSRTATHAHPFRAVAPNTPSEALHEKFGTAIADHCDFLDAKYGPGLNAWLDAPTRALIDVVDFEFLFQYKAGLSLNTSLIKRFLTVRKSWSKVQPT